MKQLEEEPKSSKKETTLPGKKSGLKEPETANGKPATLSDNNRQ